MPVRTFNYTGRDRIKHGDVQITLESGVFSVVFPSFDKYPANARVFVEPYRHGHSRHLDFGEVGGIRPPSESQRTLFDFHPPESAYFRIKIVSPEGGKILASGERISPEESGSSGKSILPVVQEDLGAECWRLSFDENDPPVVLQINKRLADHAAWKDIATSGYFLAFVYPAVLHQTLYYVLFVEKNHDMESGQYAPWLRFGARFAGENPPPPEDENADDIHKWIIRAVSGFARRQTDSIQKGIEIMKE